MENVAEEAETRPKAVNEHDAALAGLCGMSDRIDHVEISIAGLKRVHAATGKADSSALNEARHRTIGDFVATHHPSSSHTPNSEDARAGVDSAP